MAKISQISLELVSLRLEINYQKGRKRKLNMIEKEINIRKEKPRRVFMMKLKQEEYKETLETKGNIKIFYG